MLSVYYLLHRVHQPVSRPALDVWVDLDMPVSCCKANMVKKHWTDSQKRLGKALTNVRHWLGVWRKCQNHKCFKLFFYFYLVSFLLPLPWSHSPQFSSFSVTVFNSNVWLRFSSGFPFILVLSVSCLSKPLSTDTCNTWHKYTRVIIF